MSKITTSAIWNIFKQEMYTTFFYFDFCLKYNQNFTFFGEYIAAQYLLSS